MSRLPVPGQDFGTWGNILNDYLSQAHAADGTLKPGSVGAAQLQTNAIADATTSAKGVVQLAGDLAGTAALPTVPGLAGKEPTIATGTTSQYWRGDKSWQTLNAEAVGAARWLVPTVQTATYSAAVSGYGGRRCIERALYSDAADCASRQKPHCYKENR